MEVKGLPPQALSFTPCLDELSLLGLPHKLGNIEICRLISEYEGFRLTAGQEQAKSAILKAVQQGRDVIVTGPAGRGKSTLMNTLGKRFVVLPVPQVITFLDTRVAPVLGKPLAYGQSYCVFPCATGWVKTPHICYGCGKRVISGMEVRDLFRPVVWFPDDINQAQVYSDHGKDTYCLSTLEQRNEQFEHVVLE
jgi:hypothetical protein